MSPATAMARTGSNTVSPVSRTSASPPATPSEV